MNEYVLRKAQKEDLPVVSNLYFEAAGRAGCTWNEYYPTKEDAENDLSHGCLYVYENRKEVIGAVSVVPENELDDMDCWKIREDVREFARVTIRKEYSGNGLGAEMVRELLALLSEKGCRSVHILVAKCNKAALHTYKKLGFEIVSECFMYGNEYFAEEKIL